MKNKFKAGDKAVYITNNNPYENQLNVIEVGNVTIEAVILYKDEISYSVEGIGEIKNPENLYKKEEAIEFLKGVL